MENEYSRIMLEQGVPGLVLFLAFVTWYVKQKRSKGDPDYFLKTFIFFSTFTTIATAFIGIGMMTSIPGTAFLLLGLGYSISPVFGAKPPSIFAPRSDYSHNYSAIPAYQRGLARA
jgi:hypothetical protein